MQHTLQTHFLLTFKYIYIYTHLSFFLPIYLSIYLSIHPSIYLSFYLSIHPSIYLSFYLSTYLSIYLSLYLSTYLLFPLGVHAHTYWYPNSSIYIYMCVCVCMQVLIHEATHGKPNWFTLGPPLFIFRRSASRWRFASPGINASSSLGFDMA